MLFSSGLVGRVEIWPSAKKLLKACNGIFVTAILLKTPGLVEDIGWILRIDEEVGQDRHAFDVVSRKAGFPGPSFLHLPTCSISG
jgi:hypothetical protein